MPTSETQPTSDRKNIFLSFRPDEAETETTQLVHFLQQQFGENCLVQPASKVATEAEDPQVLNEAMASSYVFLALVDPAWEGRSEDGSLLIRNTDDPVYRQLMAAQWYNVPVMTVLLNSATLPQNGALPDELKPLQKQPAINIRKGKFAYDAEKLQRLLVNMRTAQKPEQPTPKKLQLINRARSVIRGERTQTSKGLEELYQELAAKDQFAYATEVLLRKMEIDREEGKMLPVEAFQTLAKFIYKDHSLPASFKFDRALKELKSHDELAKTQRCETLGLAGAIYKRKWQFDHQFKNLILSCYYYRRGYDIWRNYIAEGHNLIEDSDQNDRGFTAINYAFINEQMGVDKLEEHGRVTGLSEGMFTSFSEAKETRGFLLKQFLDPADLSGKTLRYENAPAWVTATVAEACFGLRLYDQALHFVRRYVALKVNKPWEVRTFHQQLFSLAYLQHFQQRFIQDDTANKLNSGRLKDLLPAVDDQKINDCLAAFNTGEKGEGPATVVAKPSKAGKTGLALSGGGFRASLFHIGVLAALAERDELRNIEVLSCVSGGSIIGAYYYLKLKALLETKNDEEIRRDDYIALVQEIEKEFLEGVQKNLRMRLFSDLGANFRMLFDKYYSRTHRLGELYEEYLYRPLLQRSDNEAYKKILQNENGNIYMTDLFICPKDAPESFVPANDNWKRKAKVPQLVLNATSVNTGHNWQFTASWMGEPPGHLLADIDVKPRLRRMYYEEAPERYRRFRLGFAVGASSCVPVMFRPMPLRDLYPDMDLQLVDGGLHDNQGIASLLEQECSNIIISDASGQLPTNTAAAKSEVAVFYRSDSILQERLRELQFQDIKERNYTTQISRLLTVHLKNCLQKGPVNWKYCVDPPRSIMYANTVRDENDLTEYGVLRSVQTKLAEIRTDLDSFSDVEAWALMYSGYVQMKFELGRQTEAGQEHAPVDWRFLRIKEYVTLPAKAATISKQLTVASRLAFKTFFLSRRAQIGFLVLAVLLLAWLVYLATINWKVVLLEITVKFLVLMAIVFVVGLISRLVAALVNYKATLRRYVMMFAAAIVGFIVSNIYLLLLNPEYNKSGKLKEEKEQDRA